MIGAVGLGWALIGWDGHYLPRLRRGRSFGNVEEDLFVFGKEFGGFEEQKRLRAWQTWKERKRTGIIMGGNEIAIDNI